MAESAPFAVPAGIFKLTFFAAFLAG
jgi:hypothetical protein